MKERERDIERIEDVVDERFERSLDRLEGKETEDEQREKIDAIDHDVDRFLDKVEEDAEKERGDDGGIERVQWEIGRLDEAERENIDEALRDGLSDIDRITTEAGSSEGTDTASSEASEVSDGESDTVQSSLEEYVSDSGKESEKKTKGKVTDSDEKTRPDSSSSPEEYDAKLEYHTHIHRHLKSDDYEEYEKFKQELSTGRDESDISVGRTVVNRIEKAERDRVKHEASVPDEALQHRLDPEKIQNLTEKVSDSQEVKLDELTDLVERISRNWEDIDRPGVRYAELYDPEKPLLEDEMRQIAQQIRDNRLDIGARLNERLGMDAIPHHEIRIGVTDSRLYYWTVDTNPDKWLNALAPYKMYFSEKSDKLGLIEETIRHLHIRGGRETSEIYLNDLIGQLTRIENPATNRTRIYDSSPYLDAETIHFVGDVTGRSLEDFKPILSHMGIKKEGRVWNLQFPPLPEYRMMYIAIGMSDTHLDKDGRLSYYEKEKERRDIAMAEYSKFGTFDIKIHKGNRIRVDLPRPIGAIGDAFELPRGDKAIRNTGLPEAVRNEELQIKAIYPREMVPEDGCVSGGRVSVTRHHVLHAGEKMQIYREEYGVEPLITQEQIDFVVDNAEEVGEHLCYDEGDVLELSIKKLEKLTSSTNQYTTDIAYQLMSIIDQNPNNLVKHEVKEIFEPLGVEIKTDVSAVRYYRKSQRVSVITNYCTQRIDDTIRILLISPPNHPRKMKSAVEIVTSRHESAERIKREIEQDGLKIHSTWEEYGL